MKSYRPKIRNLRVSSVLNRDTKQFGKQFAIDGNEDTCWNSDQGDKQWLEVEFEEFIEPSELRLQFQGGFVAKRCVLTDEHSSPFAEIYPEDSNSVQMFKLEESRRLKKLKINFEDLTDFFGRVTLYDLDVLGSGSVP
ncbi:NR2C2AP (predicted) [Pycnogonum litorale]